MSYPASSRLRALPENALSANKHRRTAHMGVAAKTRTSRGKTGIIAEANRPQEQHAGDAVVNIFGGASALAAALSSPP